MPGNRCLTASFRDASNSVLLYLNGDRHFAGAGFEADVDWPDYSFHSHFDTPLSLISKSTRRRKLTFL